MPAPALVVPGLPGRTTVELLPNGLQVALVHNPQAPLVATALFVRAGSRDEAPAESGIAHFLEHMMFKGSARFGLGELDRRTQALGGGNNAFTTHDCTAYTFDFAADRWQEALALESDRMRALLLDPGEVASERQVILEEVAMYEDDPWDALELAAMARFFGTHPYARPVLGTPASLAAIGAGELRAFHGRFHRPGNAVLVVAGDIGAGTLDEVAAHFGDLPGTPAAGPAFESARPRPSPVPPDGAFRLERHQGEVPRMLLLLPAPASADPTFPHHRLLATWLGGGRASRLHRALVDDGQLCLSVSVDVLDTELPGALIVACELLPGVEPAAVESVLRFELDRARGAAPTPEELARAQRLILADWVFGHERVHQQAVAVGFALVQGDLDLPAAQMRAIAAATAEDCSAASAGLDIDRSSVVAWSLTE